jgi:uncharacterized membrane-anchored protein YhcB (DUF1043 family)
METIPTGIQMMQTTLSKHVPRAATIAAALLLAVGPGAVTTALAQSGPEQTAKFTKTVENTMKSIDATKAQLEKTVAGYNSIMDQTAKDTKDAYKDLGKDLTDSEKKVAETQEKVNEMNAEADRHFAAWKESTTSITDPALRQKSEARLADAQSRYQKIAVAGKDTRQTFDALMTDLKNQATFLGSDLNAGAISSLKPDAAKFNTRAKGLFGKIDGVNQMFNDYVTAIRP